MKKLNEISLKNQFIFYAAAIMLFLIAVFMSALHFIYSGRFSRSILEIIHTQDSTYKIIIALIIIFGSGILGLSFIFRILISKFELSEEKYRNLIENLPGGIVLVSRNGHIQHINNNLLKLFSGRSEEYIKSINIYSHDPLVKAGISTRVKEVFNTSKTIFYEHDFKDINGMEFYFKEIFSPVYDKSGKISGVQILIENITGLKEAEIQVRRLLAAVDQSANSIVITDLEGKIIFVNNFFQNATGYTKEEALGQNPRILKTDFHPPEYYKDVWDKISNGHVWDGEFLNKRKDGTVFWEKAVISPVRDVSGKIINYVGIKYDITESKKFNDEIIKARAEAEKANNAKSFFLASMSHEIRTPMNAVIGMTDLLLETELSPEQKNYVMTVNNSAETLLSILNDILDLSKIESGGLKLESRVISLKDIVKNIFILFQKSASDKKIEFQMEIDQDLPESVLGDHIKVGQILTNLVNNAIKFTLKGFVKISLDLMYESDEEICVQFKVKDSGIGISPEDSINLFKPFSQADSSMTRRFGGSGLGLSISKKLTMAMDGEIFFISRINTGSTFIAIIPFKKNRDNTRKDNAGCESDAPLGVKNSDITILLVEDNQVNIRLMEAFLSKWGFNYDIAVNGSEALKLLAGKNYDLVLMDIHMPVMDGFETVMRIRQKEAPEGRHTPVIAMTANAMDGDRELCLDAGMDDYISKPIRKDELLLKIKNIMKLCS